MFHLYVCMICLRNLAIESHYSLYSICIMSAYIFANTPLQAPPRQIVFTDARFCVGFETHFTISEEYASFSNDDFRIVDANTGKVAFLVSGKVVSLREQKFLYDALANQPVWVMKHNLIKLLGRQYIISHPTTKNNLFTIKYHHQWFSNQGRKLTVTMNDGSFLQLEASKMDKIAVVTWNSGTTVMPVAKLQRPLHSVRNVVGGVQDYDITIAANVDISAIIALVIALDEEGEKQDKSQRTGGGIIIPGSSAAAAHGSHAVSGTSRTTRMYMTPNYVNTTRYPQYYKPQDLDATAGTSSGYGGTVAATTNMTNMTNPPYNM